MAKMWCINCRAERDYTVPLGLEACRHSCERRCATCGMNTLAYIQPNTNESQEEMIKQMAGEAQRIAQRTSRTGDIEVRRISGSAENSDYQAQILLVYNTYTRHYHFSKS